MADRKIKDNVQSELFKELLSHFPRITLEGVNQTHLLPSQKDWSAVPEVEDFVASTGIRALNDDEVLLMRDITTDPDEKVTQKQLLYYDQSVHRPLEKLIFEPGYLTRRYTQSKVPATKDFYLEARSFYHFGGVASYVWPHKDYAHLEFPVFRQIEEGWECDLRGGLYKRTGLSVINLLPVSEQEYLLASHSLYDPITKTKEGLRFNKLNIWLEAKRTYMHSSRDVRFVRNESGAMIKTPLGQCFNEGPKFDGFPEELGNADLIFLAKRKKHSG